MINCLFYIAKNLIHAVTYLLTQQLISELCFPDYFCISLAMAFLGVFNVEPVESFFLVVEKFDRDASVIGDIQSSFNVLLYR
jgi:hypothetical protein